MPNLPITHYTLLNNPRDYLLFTMGINFALRINNLLSLLPLTALIKSWTVSGYGR